MSETSFSTLTGRAKSFLFPQQETERPYLPDSPFSEEHMARRRVYAERWRYYLGRHDAPLKTTQEGTDHNVVVSLVTKIVNDTVNFLFGPGVEFETEPAEQGVPEIDQDLLDFWTAKPEFDWDPDEFLLDLGQVGAITGTAIIRMYIMEDNRPELVVLDPGLVEIKTSVENYRDVVGYYIYWQDEETIWHRHKIERQGRGTNQSWTISEERYIGQSKWEDVAGTEEEWAWSFPPVFVGKNLPLAHSVYGLSDIEHAGLNDIVNRNVSDINKILHYHAHPTTFLIGVTPNQVRSNLLQTGAGTLVPIPNQEANVKTMQLEGDLVASREYVKEIRNMLDDISGSVTLDPHRIGLGAMSGFALRILYRPILEKTRAKRKTYGSLLSKVNRAVLLLKGHSDPIRVTNSWLDPLPSNQEEQARIASLLSAVYTAEGAAMVANYEKTEVDALLNGKVLKSQRFFDPVTQRPVDR